MRRALALCSLYLIGCTPAGRTVRDGADGGPATPPDLRAAPDLAPGAPDLTIVRDLSMPPGMCLPGDYAGTFTGAVVIFGIVPLPTTGTVELTLASAMGGEFAEIMNGRIMGMAQGGFPYVADLGGTLDCTTNRLEMGTLKNGKVTVSGVDYLFEGTIGADYDPQTVSFVRGTWQGTQLGGPSTGMGAWTATHK